MIRLRPTASNLGCRPRAHLVRRALADRLLGSLHGLVLLALAADDRTTRGNAIGARRAPVVEGCFRIFRTIQTNRSQGSRIIQTAMTTMNRTRNRRTSNRKKMAAPL